MKRLLLLFLTTFSFCLNPHSQILYDQSGPTDVTGFWSNENSEIFAGQIVQCADDFEVPAGPKWKVQSISFRGFRGDDIFFEDHSMDSMTVQFYDNNAGVPGTLFHEETLNIFGLGEPSSTTNFNLNVLLPDSLSEGKYWLSVYGYGASNTSVFRWIGINPSSPVQGDTAVLRDELDVLAMGATDWTRLTTLSETKDLVFSIHGFAGPQDQISVEEFDLIDLELYPNPAQNTLYFGAATFVNQATIYDLNGRMIVSHINCGNEIDISNLNPAAYIIEIKTQEGIQRQKFIKQ